MTLLHKIEKMEEIVNNYHLDDVLIDLRDELKELNVKELKKVIEEKTKENRELKVGFIGRVKAGKSSLLNSLIFEGEEVLPKAATPMTAALTVLKYKEEMSAKIEFFTKEDIEDLKVKYEEYIQRYKELYKLKLEKIKANSKEKSFSEEVLKEKVKKSVLRELKNFKDLQAAYEQYEKIKESNFDVSFLNDSIKALNLTDLNEKLKEYVSSDGKYMPYTKSVTLTLKKDSLKELEIIDTPGINDPVVSREERTRELLKNCDVVFIVSPSGQFLSEEDLSLCERITLKEGIQEIYLIASQVDTQLYGSEKRDNLYESLEIISNKLTDYAKDVFEKNKFLKKLLIYKHINNNKVILNSAIAYSIYKKLEKNLPLNESEKHTFNLLKNFYVDFFISSNAKDNLYKLSNLETVKKILEDVKRRKENIQKENLSNFLNSKEKILDDLKIKIKREIENRIVTIQNIDVKKIQKKIKNLKKIEKKLKVILENEFAELINDLKIDIQEKLFKELEVIFNKAREEINENEDIKEEIYKYEVSVSRWWNPFSWGEKEIIEEKNTYIIVRAGIIRNSLEELLDSTQKIININTQKYIKEWRENAYKKLVSALRKSVGDENLEINSLKKILIKVINSVSFPKISYSSLPHSLKRSGTLERDEAEEFLNEAREFVSNLKNKVDKDIDKHIKKLAYRLSKLNISEGIFNRYYEEINQLQREVKDKENALKKYKKILKELDF